MIMKVQEDLGVGIDEGEAMLAAKEIVQERKGVRAVEEFLLKRWMRKQGEAATIAENQSAMPDCG